MAITKEYHEGEASVSFHNRKNFAVSITDTDGSFVVLSKETAIAMANDILDHYGIKQNSEIE